VRLATSPACENQAFRCGFGGIAYAIQFHLEVTPSMLEEWVREYAVELAKLGGTGDPDLMLPEAQSRCEDLAPSSRRLFKNFCRLVELRYTGVGAGVGAASMALEEPKERVRGRPAKQFTVEQAWQQYRELMVKGKLRCGVTCPLDRIGQCTGGCW
jgi:hypothetical protein